MYCGKEWLVWGIFMATFGLVVLVDLLLWVGPQRTAREMTAYAIGSWPLWVVGQLMVRLFIVGSRGPEEDY